MAATRDKECQWKDSSKCDKNKVIYIFISVSLISIWCGYYIYLLKTAKQTEDFGGNQGEGMGEPGGGY